MPKSYTYTPGGERLAQTATSGPNAGTAYYSYNDHADAEALTGPAGTTTATYGYTAYGQPIAAQTTGADKNNTAPSATSAPFNAYRFNAMRWDSSSGQYDMGFRTYAATLNQFLSRDMYNGTLADMGLATDPFTGNRYTFGAGNPISNIELDGHMPCIPGGPCGSFQALSRWSSSQAAATSIPLGFASESSFIDFSGALRNGLSQAGYRSTEPIFQGSSVTGIRFKTGESVGNNPRDYDIALAGSDVFNAAKALGIKLRAAGYGRVRLCRGSFSSWVCKTSPSNFPPPLAVPYTS